jgi:hypothetical protein
MKENPYGSHNHRHAFAPFKALEREGLAVVSRRNMLKAGLAGIAGLSLPGPKNLVESPASEITNADPDTCARSSAVTLSKSCGK